jgi:hypothetical protein
MGMKPIFAPELVTLGALLAGLALVKKSTMQTPAAPRAES